MLLYEITTAALLMFYLTCAILLVYLVQDLLKGYGNTNYFWTLLVGLIFSGLALPFMVCILMILKGGYCG